jgi:hypothetical protein
MSDPRYHQAVESSARRREYSNGPMPRTFAVLETPRIAQNGVADSALSRVHEACRRDHVRT